MKNQVLIAVFFLFLFAACNKSDIERGTPRCVKSKIHSFEDNACDTGADVKEYTYQNKTVYVFNPGNCGADMASEVIDSDCNSLGFLGGISGNNTINGQSFESAVYVKTVWTK